MVRHKGAARLQRVWPAWSADHPVAQAMAWGDGWFRAWSQQACVPWATLTRQTGISAARLCALDYGDVVRRSELEALIAAWGCRVEDVEASGAVVVD